MEYLVIGEDGTEYGPVNLATISKWVQEGRVHSATRLKNFQTGAVIAAGTLTELFPLAPAAPPNVSNPHAGNPYSTPPSNYPRQGQTYAPVNNGTADVWWAIGRSVLAVIFAALSPGAGLFIGAFGVWRGARAYSAGHRLGLAALIISIVAMVIVLGFFAWRLAHPFEGPYNRGNYQQ
jgi:hypothetical protein